ncbi:MAG: glycosyltransferase family 39 protein [Ignavibacteria bacterium]|nr:glycosyltransferase family 39 protein [Ignavibacteria bacterium]
MDEQGSVEIKTHTRSHGWWIFGAALVARFVAVLVIGNATTPQLWEFGMIAKNIISGSGYSMSYTAAGAIPNEEKGAFTVPSAYMPPAYVLFLAGFMNAFGEGPTSFLALLIAQCVIGAFSAVVLYWISTKIFSHGVGIITGYLCACYPPYLYTVTDYGSTTLYLLVLGIVWLFVVDSMRKSTILNTVLSGLAAALLALIRADGVLIACGLAVWLALRGLTPYALVFLVVLVVGLSPWLLRNYLVFDRIVPITTSFGFNFWRGHNPIASGSGREMSGEGIWGSEEIDRKLIPLSPSTHYEIERDRVFLDEALIFARSHPKEEIILAGKKLLFLWGLDLTHPKARSLPYLLSWGVMLCLFCFGLYHAIGKGYNLSLLVMYYGCMILIVLIFFVLPRYQIILSYGMVPVAALGLSMAWNQLKKYGHRSNS